MQTTLYHEQRNNWPQSGQHILAQFTETSIIVYQAYKPSIANYAVEHQQFGENFSFNRMSWLKPNFLWMMYRSGWATKEGQERILAIEIPRVLFDEILLQAVPSSWKTTQYPNHEDWKKALTDSEVRLQWDPDHSPNGSALERRAIQLGLRGEMLRRFAVTELISITDITKFVSEQRHHLSKTSSQFSSPTEKIYRPSCKAAENIQLNTP